MKDHKNFIKAASIIFNENEKLRFVCVGDGDPAYVAELKDLAEKLGINHRFIWPGGRRDMADIYSAIDINTCSSSFGEGLPNAIGEAMSCGTPCVVTDVGDCARIVGDTGEVVPPRSPQALADGWKRMIDRINRDGEEIGKRARSYIVDNFSKKIAVELTDKELGRLLRNDK